MKIKKFSKQLLSFMLVLSMVLGSVSAVFAAPTETDIATVELDVPERSSLEEEEVLIVHWLNAANQPLPSTHLALNPTSNAQQSFTMRIDFSPQTLNIYAPGEIEIRLPRVIFETRSGAAHGGYNHRLAEAHVSNTGYYYSRDGDEIVLRNFRDISGEDRFVFDISYTFTPSSVRDGFENQIEVVASFGDGEVTSEPLTFDLTTRVVPSAQVAKNHQQLFRTWNSAWGPTPADAANYFYIHYRLVVGHTAATTQPFTATIVENPENGGEIVAWGIASIVNSTGSTTTGGPWTLGNTAEFNDHAIARWTNTPGTTVRNRHLGVIVRYPRTAVNPGDSQVVTNRMTVTITGVDHDANSGRNHQMVLARHHTFTYSPPVAPPPPPPPPVPIDYFIITRNRNLANTSNASDISASNIALSLLENGHDASLFSDSTANASASGRFSARARAYDTIQERGGVGPFTTTIIDDFLYLRRGTATTDPAHFLALEPEDFRFTHVTVTEFTEAIPVYNDEGVRTGRQNLTGAARSPINLYYQVDGDTEWHHLIEFVPTATAASPRFALPDEQVTSIKAVHDNGLYHVGISLNFWLELNSTERVHEFIDGQSSVHLHSFASLQVHDAEGERINTQEVCATCTTVALGALPQGVAHIRDRDLEIYGQPVQRATASPRLHRISRQSTLTKSALNVMTNPLHERDELTYRLTANMNATSGGGSAINTTGIEPAVLDLLRPEQRQGVFYDLLPSGSFIVANTVVARDVMNRVVPHTLRLIDNYEGTGRTLVEIVVNADQRNFSGQSTGFTAEFRVLYPWESLMDYGHQLRNIASYQSRSGALGGTNVHTNADNNHATFTLRERSLMSNLSNVPLDPNERNTVSVVQTTSLSQLVVTNVGFSKTVREVGGTSFESDATALPGGTYSYRLRVQNGTMNHANDIVMFDVLESAHDGDGYWQGTFDSINTSQASSQHDVVPVVYFSTQSGLDPYNNPEHADLEDATIWTTEQPDNELITAVAVDLSQGTDGEPFVLKAMESIAVYIYMRAPIEVEEGAIAQNAAVYRANVLSLTGDLINRAHIQSLLTTVSLDELVLSISKTSDPASGTQASPTVVEVGDVVNYIIRVANESDFSVYDILIKDIVPNGMTFDLDEVKGYFGDDATMAMPISSIPRVSETDDGNTIRWGINYLDEGDSFTLIIPAQVDEELEETTRFENTARIIGITGITREIRSETTYHIAEPVLQLTYREILRELIDEARAIPVPTPQTAAWGRLMSAINAAESTYNIPTIADAQLIQQIELLRAAMNTYLGV